MPARARSPADGLPARVLIVDDHEISRAAYRALLRTEGLDVIADVRAGDQAVSAACALRPDVAVVDVTPGIGTGFCVARRLRALAVPPVVILTSSTDPAAFATGLGGYVFIAKADLCAAAIVRLAAAPGTAGEQAVTPGP